MVLELFYEEVSFWHYLLHSHEPQDLQKYNYACGFISKSSVIKYHQLLSKVISIDRKLHFDQLATATASSSTYP